MLSQFARHEPRTISCSAASLPSPPQPSVRLGFLPVPSTTTTIPNSPSPPPFQSPRLFPVFDCSPVRSLMVGFVDRAIYLLDIVSSIMPLSDMPDANCFAFWSCFDYAKLRFSLFTRYESFIDCLVVRDDPCQLGGHRSLRYALLEIGIWCGSAVCASFFFRWFWFCIHGGRRWWGVGFWSSGPWY